MTPAELTLVIPLYSGAIVLIIDRVFDAFRRLKRDEAEAQFRQSVAARGVNQDAKLHEIKTQTNGNTEKMLASIAALQIENGRLQGMVAGLQAARSSGRATDVVVTTVPAAPAQPEVEGSKG